MARIPDRAIEGPGAARDPRAVVGPSKRTAVSSSRASWPCSLWPSSRRTCRPAQRPSRRTLKEDPTSLGLVVLAGIALGAGAILFGGAVGDTNGHRRWLLVGLIGLLASPAYSGSSAEKTACWPAALLGAFWSGFAMPLGIAIVADAYPERTVQDMGIGLGLGCLGCVAQSRGAHRPGHAGTTSWASGPSGCLTDALSGAAGLVPGAGRTCQRHIVPARSQEASRRAGSGAVRGRALDDRHVHHRAPARVRSMLLALVGLAILGAIGAIAVLIVRRAPRPRHPARSCRARPHDSGGVVRGRVYVIRGQCAPALLWLLPACHPRSGREIPAAAALIPHLVPLLLGGIWAPILAYRYGYVRVILSVDGAAGVLDRGLFALASADRRRRTWWFILPLGHTRARHDFRRDGTSRLDHVDACPRPLPASRQCPQPGIDGARARSSARP